MTTQPEALRLAEALRNIAADTSLSDRYCEALSGADDELRRQHEEIKALRAALAAVRFQCEADAKAGEWTTCITKLLDAIKQAEENT